MGDYMKKIFILVILFFSCINVNAKEKDYNKIDYKNGIIVVGNLIKYVNLYDDYVEDGASFYDKNGNDLSSSIKVIYHHHGRQVSKVDTRFNDNYLVTYSINYEGKEYKASRIVIILDNEAPVFSDFKTKTITNLEVATFDAREDVFATDNSSKVKITCDNSIDIVPGSYYILCKATDESGNASFKRRLVKVISGITFDYDDKLIINFPKGDNYTYKYSFDGVNFTECDSKKILNVSSGSVIAAVYLDDKLVTSNTFFIN